jgi:hypothetical protein
MDEGRTTGQVNTETHYDEHPLRIAQFQNNILFTDVWVNLKQYNTVFANFIHSSLCLTLQLLTLMQICITKTQQNTYIKWQL